MPCWPRSADRGTWRAGQTLHLALPIATVWCATAGMPAWCAGGAHVVDDSSVEEPGGCHFENWITRQGRRAGLLVVAPACTPRALPNLEVGGFVLHDRTPGSRATSLGFTGKLTLRPEEKGVGVALNANFSYSADSARIETANVIVPLTIPLGSKVRINVDTGWQWVRTGSTHALFVGGQLEADVGHDLSLMVESFTRTIDKPGGQIGLRWTPHQGKVDFDLILGRYVDGVTPTAVTFGLTIRL